MFDLLEEHPKKLIALLVAGLLGWFGVSHMVKRHNQRVLDAVRQAEEGGRSGPAAPETSRLKELRRVEYKNPDEALRLVEAILKEPESDAELAEGRKKHANILQLCFHKRLKEGAPDEASQFMDRLVGTYPDSFQVAGVHRAWSDHHKKLCREHLQAGRMQEAKAILQSLSDTGRLFEDAAILGEYQQAMAEAALRDPGAPSMELLAEAASVMPEIGLGAPLWRVVQASPLCGEDLLELANAQGTGATKFRAITLYHAVLGRMQGGKWYPDGRDLAHEQREKLRWRVEHRLSALYGELGKAMEAGQRPVIMACDAEEMFQRAAAQIQAPALRAYLVRHQIRLQKARLGKLSKPVLDCPLEKLAQGKLPSEEHNALNGSLREAGNLANDILRRSGARLWASVAVDPQFNPWPLLSPELKAEFDAEREKGRNEESLRQSLASRGGPESFRIPLPELAAVRQLECEIHARRGLIIHGVNPGECTNWLRRALAGTSDEDFRQRVVAAVSTAMMNRRGEQNFDAFYELTRFFVGDIGLENLPPERQAGFCKALGEAAESMAQRSRPKAIFLWAIQAEIYPVGAEGNWARQQATEAAFREVAGVRVEEVKAESLEPSGRPGVSVHSVDNSTEYHLLLFYKGPDSFFLACRPYRKVSALLRDGEYELAVITPSGAIRPYHGKVELQGSWKRSNYRIGTEEENRAFRGHFSSSASGSYQLVRRPEGMETVSLDPATGGIERR